jgi:uncharacterized protein YkwD
MGDELAICRGDVRNDTRGHAAIPTQMRISARRFACDLLKVATLLAGLLLMPTPASAQDWAGEISQYRRAHGLSAVRSNAQLTEIARRQARAMASTGVMDHSVAGSFAGRILATNADAAAENIAAGTHTWAETFRVWKSSPGHNANLLLAGATSVGVAMAVNPQTRMRTFWAMVIANMPQRHTLRRTR